ncbi:hypothetical protein FRC15_003431 [Serendipita sp. 397]|nr:hypothetical protein FRC15_003431 [Serendipita sp. 397]
MDPRSLIPLLMNSTQNLPLPLRHAVQELGEGLWNLSKCRYTSVAGLTVVMYDIVLLLSDEIRLVWQRPKKNPSRIAYFINRYVPPVFLIVSNYHLSGFRGPLTNTLQELGLSSGNRLSPHLHMRYLLALFVLNSADRTFTVIIYTLFAVSYGICFGITVDAAVFIQRGFYFDKLANVCNVGMTPYIFKFIFLTPIFFEILIGVLTFWKCIQHAYIISHASAAPMIHIMLRDGLIWWTLVIGLRVWNALIWVLLPHSLIYLGIYVHWALVSTAVSRFFLNILDVGSHETVDGFSAVYVTYRDKEREFARSGLNPLGPGEFIMDIRRRETSIHV